MQTSLECLHDAAESACACKTKRRTPEILNSRQRFLSACACQKVDRPPIWLMRQAGRVLPEYRALKERHSFLELVKTPELAAEVTLQPVRRFGFDAAILFSDILVVPEALGQPYHFQEAGGVRMSFRLENARDIERLDPRAVDEQLEYVSEAIRLVKPALTGQTALIGFAGSPWTLANFMLEGGSSKDFKRAKALFYSNRPLFNRLMEKLTQAVAGFLERQLDAGVDAIQVFDSLGGGIASNAYEAASGRWIAEIITRLNGRVPVIVFAKGVHGSWDALVDTKANVLGVDWTVSLNDVACILPENVGLQGNLDPEILLTNPDVVRAEAALVLAEMKDCPGFIFNLGHGVPPAAPLENIHALVETVQGVL